MSYLDRSPRRLSKRDLLRAVAAVGSSVLAAACDRQEATPKPSNAPSPFQQITDKAAEAAAKAGGHPANTPRTESQLKNVNGPSQPIAIFTPPATDSPLGRIPTPAADTRRVVTQATATPIDNQKRTEVAPKKERLTILTLELSYHTNKWREASLGGVVPSLVSKETRPGKNGPEPVYATTINYMHNVLSPESLNEHMKKQIETLKTAGFVTPDKPEDITVGSGDDSYKGLALTSVYKDSSQAVLLTHVVFEDKQGGKWILDYTDISGKKRELDVFGELLEGVRIIKPEDSLTVAAVPTAPPAPSPTPRPLFTPTAKAEKPDTGWLSYTPQLGYTIYYPPKWKVVTSPYDPMGLGINIIPSDASAMDVQNARSRVSVSLLSFTGAIPAEASLKEALAAEAKSVRSAIFPYVEVKPLETSNFTGIRYVEAPHDSYTDTVVFPHRVGNNRYLGRLQLSVKDKKNPGSAQKDFDEMVQKFRPNP